MFGGLATREVMNTRQWGTLVKPDSVSDLGIEYIQSIGWAPCCCRHPTRPRRRHGHGPSDRLRDFPPPHPWEPAFEPIAVAPAPRPTRLSIGWGGQQHWAEPVGPQGVAGPQPEGLGPVLLAVAGYIKANAPAHRRRVSLPIYSRALDDLAASHPEVHHVLHPGPQRVLLLRPHGRHHMAPPALHDVGILGPEPYPLPRNVLLPPLGHLG